MPDNPSDFTPDGLEEPTQPAGQEAAALARQLFSGISMRGPVEELERVYQNRARGLKSSGSREQIDRLSRGFEIARERLSDALVHGGDPGGQDDARQDEGGEGLDG
ncbi:MAG TPA: hypothetical protein DD471_10455 [Planctomycetes bacterium]|jgi:hypothetical protein|nr:hypothetical protein [Planctomycetota bacterium]|tara:strand:+ start:310 stop:627 length:318 start_codon:yes stop_codon:yes gene_type:complete